ncbi:MAG: trigger factor [Patescibacteria group bacterium]|jgi:FKBP-type peptidyl-prolyl cis-trans isomerase (trigger factor)
MFEINWLPKKTFEITVTIPWKEVDEAKSKAISEAGKNLELKGFRKGNAPPNMVVEALGPQKLLELTLRDIIPEYYQKAISELKLNPIVTPKVQLLETKEGESWKVKLISCVEPVVTLGNYKEELKKENATKEIWTPGKGEEKKAEKKPEEERDEKLNRAIDWLIKNIKVEVCDLIVDEEVSRKLSGLLEQTQKLGLTVDQYLSSTGKTVEQIREEYARQAQENLALEFIFSKIADEENIEVKPEDLEKVMAEAKTDEERKALEGQKYYIATILRRQKTLDFLASL